MMNTPYARLAQLPDEEAVDLLEEFGQVPDWVEKTMIARFRAMRIDLSERAMRVFIKRGSAISNTTAGGSSYLVLRNNG